MPRPRSRTRSRSPNTSNPASSSTPQRQYRSRSPHPRASSHDEAEKSTTIEETRALAQNLPLLDDDAHMWREAVIDSLDHITADQWKVMDEVPSESSSGTPISMSMEIRVKLEAAVKEKTIKSLRELDEHLQEFVGNMDETIAEWRRYQAFRAEWRTVPILVAHDIKLRCLQLCLLGLSSDAFTTLDSGGDRWNDVIHGVRTLFDFYKELANKDFDNEKKARLISKWLKRLHHSIEQMREYCADHLEEEDWSSVSRAAAKVIE
ncbi:hypothetical protein JCM3766R1_006065 [Sporobolomyces carnicolor]